MMSEPRKCDRRSASRKKVKSHLSQMGHSALAICLACGLMVPAVGYADSSSASNELFSLDSVEDIAAMEGAGQAEGDNFDASLVTDIGVSLPEAIDETDQALETDEAQGDFQGFETGSELDTTTLESQGECSAFANNEIAFQSSGAPDQLTLSDESLKEAGDQGLVIEGTVVTGYFGSTVNTHLVIPEGVTEIAAGVFQNQLIETVVFPSSLKTIGDNAFNSCQYLTEATLPEGLVSIGSSAFNFCPLLTEVYVPASLQSVGRSPFSTRSSANYIVGDGATEVPAGLFENSTISGLSLPDSIMVINNDAFRYANLPSEIRFPSSLKSIGESAFSGCSGLSEVRLPEGLESIGDYSFSGCEDLTYVSIPSTLQTVTGQWEEKQPFQRAFDGSSQPIAFEIEQGATVIPAWLFKGADIANIDIPDSVTVIEESAFCQSAIKELDLPNSLEKIGSQAFMDCEYLERVTISSPTLATTPKQDGTWRSVFGGSGISTEQGGTSFVLEEGVGVVPSYMFQGAAIADIVLPSSLKAIGEVAFADADFKSQEITLPAGVSVIEQKAFSDCSLDQLVVQGDIESVNDPGFESIESLVFDEGVTVIPTGMFSGSIQSVSFPSTLKRIEARAFEGVSDLSSIDLPEGLVYLGPSAFADCKNLQSVFIPSSLGTERGTEAGEGFDSAPFSGCESLNDVTFGEGISVIPEGLLSNTGLSSITIPDSVEEVHDWAFYGTDLRDAYVPSSVVRFEQGMYNSIFANTTLIHCAAGSPAHSYAEKNGLLYILDLDPHPNYARANLHVVDAVTLSSIEGASVTLSPQFSEEEGALAPQISTTDSDGNAQFYLPAGPYYIQIEKDGYQLRGFEYQLEVGETTLPDIGIATENLVQGSLAVSEMNKDEIMDAGIDMDAPGNEHIYKYEITLKFSDGLEIPSITYKNENGEEVGGSFGGVPLPDSGPITIDAGGDGEEREPIKICRVNEMLYIVIQGEAKWLKEMYHVQLLAVNTSQTDQVSGAVATLELPEGLSLADTTIGSQSLSYEVGDMPTGEQKTVDWYVRGDSTGDYTLNATLSGKMQPFGDSFTYAYQNEEPLHVYAGTDMKLTVHIDDAAYYQEPYTMYFELENVSDRTIYNITHQINNVSQYQVKEYAWIEDGRVVDSEEEWNLLDSTDVGAEGRISRDEFRPGEKLWIKVTTNILWESPLQRLVNTADKADTIASAIPLIGASMPTAFGPISAAVSLASNLDVRYWLADAVVSTLEGSTATIPVEFDVNHVQGIRILDKALEEILGFDPNDKEDIAETTIEDLVSVIFGNEVADVGKFVYERTKSYAEVLAEDEITVCHAWVETVEGSDVIAISVGAAAVQGLSTRSGDSATGEMSFLGNTELTVEALNPGVADLVVQDSDGNVARKRYVVREELPAQNRYLPEGTDILDLDYVLIPGGTLLDENTAALYEQLGLTLYSDDAADAQPIAVGSTIPTGAVLRSTITEAGSPIIVPGDVNSDGFVDEVDISIMETDGCMGAMSNAQRLAGDLTGDDVVNEQDAAVLREYLGVQVDVGDPGDDPALDDPDDPSAPPDADDDPEFSEGPDSGEGGASEQWPSDNIEVLKNEIINDLDELIESIEGSALPDDKKQALISKAQEMKDQTANASSSDALSTLRNEVSAYVSEVGSTIESEGQGQGQEQESIDSGNDRDDDSGSGGSAAAKSDHARPKALIVATGDMSPQIVSSVLVFAMLGVIGLVIARRRIR